MATELRLRGGTTAQHDSFTGAQKEVTVDIDKNTVVVHDGSTEGGFPLAKDSELQGLSDSLGNLAFEDDASDVEYDNSTSGLAAENVQAAIDELSEVEGKAIGEIFYLWDHLSGVDGPDNSGDAKYIRLTANDSYNDGLLTDETVTGSSPLVEAVATIATGPLQGNGVYLLNTMEAMLRPRETSGERQFDQMQRITGALEATGGFGLFEQSASTITNIGALEMSNHTGNRRNVGSASSEGGKRMDFDSADSPSARTSAGTGGETRAKNVSATAYMRIA